MRLFLYKNIPLLISRMLLSMAGQLNYFARVVSYNHNPAIGRINFNTICYLNLY